MKTNPQESAAVPDVKEEEKECSCRLGAYHVGCPIHWPLEKKDTPSDNVKAQPWTIRDSGGVGVRDVWCGDQLVCVEVPPGIAKAFCDAHNKEVEGKKEAVADSVEVLGQNELTRDRLINEEKTSCRTDETNQQGEQPVENTPVNSASAIAEKCAGVTATETTSNDALSESSGSASAPSVPEIPKSDNAAGVSSPNSVPANAQGPMEETPAYEEAIQCANAVNALRGEVSPQQILETVKPHFEALARRLSLPSVINEQPADKEKIQAAADHEGLLQCRELLNVRDGDNLYDAIKRLLEEKEAVTRNTAVLQNAREALSQLYKAANQSICEYGSARTLWATFVRDVAWGGLKGLLSEADGQPEGASGVSLDDETCHCGQPMKTHDQSHDPRPLSAGYPKSERRIHEC